MPLNGSATSSQPVQSHPATLTSEASLTCDRPTLADSSNAISSLASADGPTPCGSPDGPTTDLFGRALAPASHSAERASEPANRMSATFGRIGTGSSSSGALQRSLENRLKTRLPLVGWMTPLAIWKRPATPARRRFFRLILSAAHMKDNEFGLLPTVTKGRNGPGGTGGCKAAKRIFGRDWYFPHEAAWIMGFPEMWLKLAPSETPSSLKSQRSSSQPMRSVSHDRKVP